MSSTSTPNEREDLGVGADKYGTHEHRKSKISGLTISFLAKKEKEL